MTFLTLAPGDVLLGKFDRGPVGVVTVAQVTPKGMIRLEGWPDLYNPVEAHSTGTRRVLKDLGSPRSVWAVLPEDDVEGLRREREKYEAMRKEFA